MNIDVSGIDTKHDENRQNLFKDLADYASVDAWVQDILDGVADYIPEDLYVSLDDGYYQFLEDGDQTPEVKKGLLSLESLPKKRRLMSNPSLKIAADFELMDLGITIGKK